MNENQTAQASDAIVALQSLANEKQRTVLMRFFKTGKGEYGEGDCFLGVKVPQTRIVAKECADMSLEQVHELLMSHWHEARLCGLLILVNRFERLCTKRLTANLEATHQRDEIVQFYLQHSEQVNNWDLVDLSVHKIIGNWLLLPTFLGGADNGEPRQNIDFKRHTLDALAGSGNLWQERMSIVCSWKTSQHGDPSWCLTYAEKHLHHKHDLMHKAVGWMLRELGSRISMDMLREFLSKHAHEMPRTALRYAIEKMPYDERQYWLTSSKL